MSARIVVVGGGLAGWSSAAAAAECGARVTLLEKCDRWGGSTVLSGGFLALAGTELQRAAGIEDGPELLEADLLASGGGHCDPALVHAYAAGQDEFVDWLFAHGLIVHDIELSSGQSVPRSHRSDPADFIERLADAATRPGAAVRFGTAVDALQVSGDGSVIGVRVGSNVIEADTVILASGGFSRSEELLARHAPGQAGALRVGGAGSTGDGLRLGESVGAAMRDFEFVKGTFGTHPETRPDRHELLLMYYAGAIIVNAVGDRFVNESIGYKLLGDACLAQPGSLAYQVWDQALLDASPPGVALFDARPMIARGQVVRADTLAELTAATGMDAGHLESSMSEYNRVVAGEAVDRWGRTGLVNGAGELRSLRTPPFYAFPSTSALIATYCGLVVDVNARVLRRDGSIIAGLRAAGEVVGGFHGSSYMTGTSLGKAAFFGRIAGEEAAAGGGKGQTA